MKNDDFRLQTLRLLEGLNRVVNAQSEDSRHIPFSLYKRASAKKEAGKSVYRYYVRFWDPQAHSYQSGISTGQTSKAAAFAWAMARLGEGKRNRPLTWDELTGTMFDPGSEFLTFYQPLKKSFGEVHRRHCRVYAQDYILPVIGSLIVSKLDSRALQTLQIRLLERRVETKLKADVGPRQARERKRLEGTPVTVQKIMGTVRLMVKWANQTGELKTDPFLGFIPASATKTQRGILEAHEIHALFQQDTEAWTDMRLRVFCLVAATSGLRSGELQGLLRDSVKEIIDPQGRPAGVLLVSRSWSQIGELKSTKSGNPRRATVPWYAYKELVELMRLSPFRAPGDFVFYQAKRNLPISAQMIHEHFTKALSAIGIGNDQRKERNITFHSFRHYVNTRLVEAGIPLLRIQALIGHNSKAMTSNYYHTGNEYADILQAQDSIFLPHGSPHLAIEEKDNDVLTSDK